MTIVKSRARQLVNRLVYQRVVGKWLLLPIVRRGLISFEKSGQTSKISYVAMRKLFGNKNATLFDLISEPLKINVEEVGSKPNFEGIASHEIDHLVHQLRERVLPALRTLERTGLSRT